MTYEETQAQMKVYAEVINNIYAESIELTRKTIENARDIGDTLIQAKHELQHGQWGRWVDKYLPFGRQQASKYMKLATDWDSIPPDVKSNYHFNLDKVLGSMKAMPELPPLPPAIPTLKYLTRVKKEPKIHDRMYYSLLAYSTEFNHRVDRWLHDKYRLNNTDVINLNNLIRMHNATTRRLQSRCDAQARGWPNDAEQVEIEDVVEAMPEEKEIVDCDPGLVDEPDHPNELPPDEMPVQQVCQ